KARRKPRWTSSVRDSNFSVFGGHMNYLAGLALIALLFQQPSPVEVRIVEYLKKNVTPGRPVVVSELYNNVFKTPEEQKVLNRLYNTFFKIRCSSSNSTLLQKRFPHCG